MHIEWYPRDSCVSCSKFSVCAAMPLLLSFPKHRRCLMFPSRPALPPPLGATLLPPPLARNPRLIAGVCTFLVIVPTDSLLTWPIYLVGLGFGESLSPSMTRVSSQQDCNTVSEAREVCVFFRIRRTCVNVLKRICVLSAPFIL